MSTDKPPLVSIIIPVFNRPHLLKEALGSVDGQTYRNLEVIVVDDGSTEDIRAVVEEFVRKVEFPVVYVRQENSGPGIARGNGLSHSNGILIQYLDSDDLILPEKIECQVKELVNHPEAVMCYTATVKVNERGEETKRKLSDLPADDLLAAALHYRRWATASCLWRYPNKHIVQWTNLYNGEDLVHDVHVGVQYRKIVFIPQPLTITRALESGHVSAIPQDPNLKNQYLDKMITPHEFAFEALRKYGLERNYAYAEPLAGRFFFVAMKLAKLGRVEAALKALFYTRQLTLKFHVRTFVKLATLSVKTFGGKQPNLYKYIFRLYKTLSTPSARSPHNTI
jgi:glycosyltransferase involved in cell wall biosynthesis